MKYEILATGRFKKDLKSIMRRGYNIQLLQDVVSLLAAGSPLPEKNKDHALSGNWYGRIENVILLPIGFWFTRLIMTF